MCVFDMDSWRNLHIEKSREYGGFYSYTGELILEKENKTSCNVGNSRS